MEEKEIKRLLEDEIRSEIEKVSSLTPGNADHAKAVESLATLYKLNIEQTENDREFMARCDHDLIEEREMLLKTKELEERKKDRYFKLGLEGGSLILTLVCYGIWMSRGFKFEETGTYTSNTFRNLINRFRPTR